MREIGGYVRVESSLSVAGRSSIERGYYCIGASLFMGI